MSEIPVEATVGPHFQSKLPIMRGHARMARGADSEFEVPIFTRLTRFLWMGCSPAEFPDELEADDYSPYTLKRYRKPVRCHWLFMGEHRNGEDALVPRFSAILNLYPWVDYVVPDGVSYRAHEMYDSGDIPDKGEIDSLASWVIGNKGMKGTGRVFVHCQAGLNRSSLVCARVLMLEKGMTADEAIAHIRERRSQTCLCNETFEQFLRSL